MKNIDLERANYALKCVRSVINNKKEYKALVKGFPTMIINNGLGQAMAFLKAKDKDYHKNLSDHIIKWFKKQGFISNDKVEDIINTDDDNYRLMTQEALFVLNWFRKIVDAEIKDEDSGVSENE